MKFKVGDKVRVSTALKGGRDYGSLYFNPSMDEYRGCIYEIATVGRFTYRLKGIEDWEFNDSMLEPVENIVEVVVSKSTPDTKVVGTVADMVNHPPHYTQYRFEVIDVIEDATKDLKGIEAVCIGNVIKYVLRYKFKNGVQDLKKARFYLDKVIGILE